MTNVYEAAQCRVTLLDERMTTDIITVIDSQRSKVRRRQRDCGHLNGRAGGRDNVPVGWKPGQCASGPEARPMCQWARGQANVPVG